MRFPFAPSLATLGLLAATSLPAQDFGNLDAAQRDALNAQIRAYLLENPEVIVEAMNVLEERQNKAAVASQADVLFNDEGSWVGGNVEGDVTMVEFIDYACGYCKRSHPVIKDLVADDGNIRLIRKEFPILSEGSLQAARFAVATKIVVGDDAYEQVSEALIGTPGQALRAEVFQAIADQLELDWDAISAQMEGEEVTAILARTQNAARALGINSTPSFVIGEDAVSGALPRDAFEAYIAKARDAKSE